MNNQEQKPRNYVGNGVQSGDYYVNLSIKYDQLEQHVFEYNGAKYVRLTLGKNKEVTQYGKTHSVWINDYQPDAKGAESNQPKAAVSAGDGLPF